MFWMVTAVLVMLWIHVLDSGNTVDSFPLYISLYAVAVALLLVSLNFEAMIHRKLRQMFRRRGQET